MGCQFSQNQKTSQPHKKTIRNKKSKIIDSRRFSTQFTNQITQNVVILENKLNKEELKFASKSLMEHQFFSTLKQNQIDQIVKQMVVAQAKAGEYVFKQGDLGNSFFIIYSGKVEVQINGDYIRTLTKEKSFGQLALLFKTQRTASIKCIAQNNLFLILKPKCFRQTLKNLKIYQLQKYRKMIDNSQIFQGLTNKQKEQISQHLKAIQFKKDEIIFKTDDLANAFYIISSGEIKIQIQSKQPIILKTLDSFGQNAFKPNSKRIGTATCILDTVCYYLQKIDLQNIFGRKFDNIFHYNLKKWALVRADQLAFDAFTINYLIPKFQIIVGQQGTILEESNPKGIYINLQGTINGKFQGSIFGVKNFKDRNFISRPIILSSQCTFAYLSFEKLDKYLKQIQQLKNSKEYSKKNIPLQKQNIYKPNLNKFQFIKQLGCGQFGKVHLVKDNQNGGMLYALKCLNKDEIKRQAMQKCVIQQKRILSKIVFPYIVGYSNSFHDQKNIYILMQYIKGKQMFDVIRQMPVLNKKIASYFFGCIFLAIEHLHEHNIIYRDIKPQNSVVDSNGKVFLIDLGTAKVLNKQTSYRTFTMIGTPHYMAPEIMQGKGYSFEVDIWSLGILLYEFTCGCLPFGQNQNDPYAVMRIIKNDQVKFSPSVSQQLRDLLLLLLQKNPKVRSIKATFQKIKQSKYFSDFSWSDLFKQKVSNPYIPKDFRKVTHQNTMKIQGKPLGDYLYGNMLFGRQWQVKQWNQQFYFKKDSTISDKKKINNQNQNNNISKHPFGQINLKFNKI